MQLNMTQFYRQELCRMLCPTWLSWHRRPKFWPSSGNPWPETSAYPLSLYRPAFQTQAPARGPPAWLGRETEPERAPRWPRWVPQAARRPRPRVQTGACTSWKWQTAGIVLWCGTSEQRPAAQRAKEMEERGRGRKEHVCFFFQNYSKFNNTNTLAYWDQYNVHLSISKVIKWQ